MYQNKTKFIIGWRMCHTNKVFTFNMVAMPERDALDRTFWMGVVKIHASPTSFTDAFTTDVPSAFLETRSIQSVV